MCYAAGSLDQACPMCKVFLHAKCPHVREICRNRTSHPRMDVVYIKNAEVERFSGCGYCKWANSDPQPPAIRLRYNNPGWAGCCRRPDIEEYRSIPAADWPAVNIVHQIPIPADIQAVLENITTRAMGPPGTAHFSIRTPTRLTSARRNTGRNSPSSHSRPPSLGKVVLTPTSNRTRPSASPQETTPNLSRSNSSNAISSSVPNASGIDYHPHERRLRGSLGNSPDKRVEGVHSLHSSPNRKSVDLDSSSSPRRVSSVKRPSVTPATTSVSVTKVVVQGPSSTPQTQQPFIRGRVDISKPEPKQTKEAGPSPSANSPPGTSEPSRPPLVIVPPETRKRDDQELSSASSSSGSSDGIGSASDNTVTSEGFTDYLSDESEAELQRQAEAKAALVALTLAEEREFKAAREQLAHVDLRPPKLWNPTNITNTPPSRSARVGYARS